MNFTKNFCVFISTSCFFPLGYGHVTPLSRSGKVFCMIYAVIGIPMTLVLLSALVERLLVPTVWLLQWLNSQLGRLYQPFNIRLLHLSIIGTKPNSNPLRMHLTNFFYSIYSCHHVLAATCRCFRIHRTRMGLFRFPLLLFHFTHNHRTRGLHPWRCPQSTAQTSLQNRHYM